MIWMHFINIIRPVYGSLYYFNILFYLLKCTHNAHFHRDLLTVLKQLWLPWFCFQTLNSSPLTVCFSSSLSQLCSYQLSSTNRRFEQNVGGASVLTARAPCQDFPSHYHIFTLNMKKKKERVLHQISSVQAECTESKP